MKNSYEIPITTENVILDYIRAENNHNKILMYVTIEDTTKNGIIEFRFPAKAVSEIFDDSICMFDQIKSSEFLVYVNQNMQETINADVKGDTVVLSVTLQPDSGVVEILGPCHYVSESNIPIMVNSEWDVNGKLLSPLKQFKSGIAPKDVVCNQGLELVIKESNGSPACVRPQSIAALLLRGWSMEGNELIFDMSAGQREGSVLVKEIFSDHISGLNFMEYPVARDEGFPILLHVGETASNGCTVEMTLLRINDKTATFLKKEYHDRTCPICLSENTVIDTPNGPLNIMNLKEGMDIFTLNAHGNKYVGTILATGKTAVSPDHKMVHIVLNDGRDLHGSPNHPTTEGMVLGELQVGDSLDGSTIKFVETIRYNGTYTYDILPSGETGYYWANKILIKSTLD